MNKKVLGSAVALAMVAGVNTSANAALSSNATLLFDAGAVTCVIAPDPSTATGCAYDVTTVTGSYFGMDTSGDGVIQDGEKNALTPGTDGGIILGQAQGEGAIDVEWSFGGNPGNHVSGGLAVASASGNTASIDMTGWTVMWGTPKGPIDMGQGTDGTDYFANVTCGVDCAAGDTFTLDYAAIVPSGGFAGFYYTLSMTGTIGAPSAVPVPAAVWLFGSGLLGLAGVARRRKAA